MSSEHPGQRHEHAAGGPPRILVVDDNVTNLHLLTVYMEKFGYPWLEARDGRSALELLRREPIDLVLLDIMMPDMNGFEVLEAMKREPGLRDIPVVVISAATEVEDIARGIQLGAEDYLPKPFEPVLLRARIESCLERKRLRDQERLAQRLLDQERLRYQELLHVLFPHEIVEELRIERRIPPRRFPCVTVLFCDIVGFTQYCDGRDPEDVHSDIQRLVEAFEEITERHGLEKIKTVGDAYMAAADLVKPIPKPLEASIRCGLEMIATASALPPHWQVRVGVHSGPVTAGVVGRRKYIYDLWGDTVNTAARVETLAPPGTLAVSETVWAAAAPHLQGVYLGSYAVRGKGTLDLYQVTGLAGEDGVSAAGPVARQLSDRQLS